MNLSKEIIHERKNIWNTDEQALISLVCNEPLYVIQTNLMRAAQGSKLVEQEKTKTKKTPVAKKHLKGRSTTLRSEDMWLGTMLNHFS